MLFDPEGNILIRQSWLDNAMRCAERGRQGIVNPQMDDVTSDSAAIGTGAHAGCETILNGGSEADARAAITAAIVAEVANGIKWTKNHSVDELHAYAQVCFTAWLKDIYPEMKLGGRAEVKFEENLYTLDDGRNVGITGTVDYVLAPELIDWKTSARPYKQRDKQMHAIQPSIYSWAAVRGAFGPGFEWPVRFTYGIMIRPSNPTKPARTELVSVVRHEAHARWALEQITTYVNMALKFGLDTRWPMVAENNYLCSRRWCAWYDLCRGSHLSAGNDAVPVALSY